MEGFLKSAMDVILRELGSEPYYMKLMLIELVDSLTAHNSLPSGESAKSAVPPATGISLWS